MDLRRINLFVQLDINEGLVDGPVEGRTGVHVDSEVVLSCA